MKRVYGGNRNRIRWKVQDGFDWDQWAKDNPELAKELEEYEEA